MPGKRRFRNPRGHIPLRRRGVNRDRSADKTPPPIDKTPQVKPPIQIPSNLDRPWNWGISGDAVFMTCTRCKKAKSFNTAWLVLSEIVSIDNKPYCKGCLAKMR